MRPEQSGKLGRLLHRVRFIRETQAVLRLHNEDERWLMSAIPPYSQFEAGHSSVRVPGAVPPKHSTDVLLTNSESHEQYRRVILNVSAQTRVIICKNNIQWILQKRVSGG